MASKYTIRGVADMTQHDEQLKKSAAEVYKYEKNVKSASGQLNQFSNAAKNVASGVDTLNDGFSIMNNSTAPLKLKLRELTNVLGDMEMQGKSNTVEFTQLAQYAGTLKDALGDAQQAIRGYSDDAMSIEAATQAMGALASIGSVATGVMGLLGTENEDLQRTLVKVQSVMAVSNGIQQVTNALNKDSVLMLKIKSTWSNISAAAAGKEAVAMGASTVATTSNTVATKAWNVAKAISKALFGDFTGLILVGAAALTTYSLATSDAKDAEEEQNKALEESKKKIDEQRESYVKATEQYNNTASRIDHLRTAYMNTNSELEKTTIIKEAAEEFKKLGISINDAADAQDVLVNKGQYVTELLRNQGNAAALAAIRMEAYKKSFSMLLENGYDTTAASILAGSNDTVRTIDKELDRLNTKASELKGKLNIGSGSKPSSSNSSSKSSSSTSKKDNTIDIEKFLNRKEKYGEIQIEPVVSFDYKSIDLNSDEFNKSLQEHLNTTQQTLDERKIKINLEPFAEGTNYVGDIIGNVDNAVDSIDRLKTSLEEGATAWDIFVNAFAAFSSIINGISSSIEAFNSLMQIMGTTTEATSAISTAAAEQDTANTATEVANSISKTTAKSGEAIANATASGSKLPFPANLAAIAAGVAAVVAALAMISGFANGGIVGGQTTIGDYNLARVNKGEMILNGREQSRMFNLLSGSGSIAPGLEESTVKFRISGPDLVGVLKNYDRKRGKVS